MKRLFRLVTTQARESAIKAIWEAPDGSEVRLSDPTRNLDQNAKFHAVCGELEKKRILWGGRPRTTDEWKTLLVAGHAQALGEPAEVVMGLEGEMVQLRESTASMSKRRSSSLIEYSTAFLAQQGD